MAGAKDTSATRTAERAERLKAALRANLRRRKQQGEGEPGTADSAREGEDLRR
jgi:hypothetical protein